MPSRVLVPRTGHRCLPLSFTVALKGIMLIKTYSEERPMKLETGQKAPDFTLPSHLGSEMTLSSFRGKSNVVLAFFPLAWTPV